jgi:hypothetical protein
MWLIAAARGVRSPAGLRGRWPAPAGTRGPAGDRTRSMVLTRTSGASDPSTQSGGSAGGVSPVTAKLKTETLPSQAGDGQGREGGSSLALLQGAD